MELIRLFIAARRSLRAVAISVSLSRGAKVIFFRLMPDILLLLMSNSKTRPHGCHAQFGQTRIRRGILCDPNGASFGQRTGLSFKCIANRNHVPRAGGAEAAEVLATAVFLATIRSR